MSAATISRVPIAAPIRPGYWRITGEDGRVMGSIEELTAADGARFRAQRFRQASVDWAPLGSFGRIADAIDAFRA